MKKLGKKSNITEMSIEAYACSCSCTCGTCNCSSSVITQEMATVNNKNGATSTASYMRSTK